MSGTLERVPVKEGDTVETGAVLAEIDAKTEKTLLDAANARLRRVKAGNGAEEVAAALAEHDAVLAELAQAERDATRAEKLHKTEVVADDFAESQRQRAVVLRHRSIATKQRYEALKRGPLPEDVAAAQAEVEAARANHDLRLVRAPSSGTILRLLRHSGDFVSVSYPSPIIRMADMSHLQIRVEIAEPDAARVRPGQEGAFTGFGMTAQSGCLKITAVLPAFGPKRLFDPDTTARMDTRTLDVLCEITKTNQPVFSGQREVVRFDAGKY
jgi:HlyD family secretion protein